MDQVFQAEEKDIPKAVSTSQPGRCNMEHDDLRGVFGNHRHSPMVADEHGKKFLIFEQQERDACVPVASLRSILSEANGKSKAGDYRFYAARNDIYCHASP